MAVEAAELILQQTRMTEPVDMPVCLVGPRYYPGFYARHLPMADQLTEVEALTPPTHPLLENALETVPGLTKYMELPTDPDQQELVGKAVRATLMSALGDGVMPTFASAKAAVDGLKAAKVSPQLKERLVDKAVQDMGTVSTKLADLNHGINKKGLGLESSKTEMDEQRRIHLSRRPEDRAIIEKAREGKKPVDISPLVQRANPAERLQTLLGFSRSMIRTILEDPTVPEGIRQMALMCQETDSEIDGLVDGLKPSKPTPQSAA